MASSAADAAVANASLDHQVFDEAAVGVITDSITSARDGSLTGDVVDRQDGDGPATGGTMHSQYSAGSRSFFVHVLCRRKPAAPPRNPDRLQSAQTHVENVLPRRAADARRATRTNLPEHACQTAPSRTGTEPGQNVRTVFGQDSRGHF